MKKKMLAISLALAMGFSLLSGCTQPSGEKPTPDAQPTAKVLGEVTFENTVAWDGEYDVVVVGFGGAGAAAAVSAADAGANVLLLEKAPEGHEGGNTRYCGQYIAYGNGDHEATMAYYTALQGNRSYDGEVLETYAKGIADMKDTLVNDFGADPEAWIAWGFVPILAKMSPEYPELPGSDKIDLCTITATGGPSHFWKFLRQNVTDRADKIDVWFESPAVHLIQDPGNKTIIGVQTERGGKTLNIRAKNGVVMACGGFENNPEMIESYLGIAKSAPVGTLYNTGDGVRMAMEVGADLWHMDVYEGDGIGFYGSMSYVVDEGERAIKMDSSALGDPNCAFASGSVMLLAADGSRYLREDEVSRHGHIYQGGTWDNPKRPTRSFLFFDGAQREALLAMIPAEVHDQIIEADSLAAMAEATGMNADILAKTVADFNGFAAAGEDLAFGRSGEHMRAFTKSGPYYALELFPAILNTQGGARRNGNAEVVGADGDPIPHLYSAGEFGGVTSFMYQGGGNMAECVIFGQLAGRNAAEPKSYTSTVLSETIGEKTYTIGVESDIGGADYSDIPLGENEYLGVGAGGMGGEVAVKVTMDGDQIAKVEVVRHMETDGIGTKAIDAVPEAIVAAQSTEVDNIAGATMTSKAIKAAVEDALSKTK